MTLGTALGAVGAIVGTYFGGPIGGQIGYMAGSMIGNMIDPPKGTKTEGPKLDDLTSQTVSYGTVVGTVYGRYQRAGNVFWATEKKQHSHTEVSGGKGGGATATTITYTYTQSFAIGLSDREILGVKTIKANGKVIYSTDETASPGSKITSSEVSGYFRVYSGAEDQLPDPTMESTDGVGSVPAYRGTAYIMFTDFPLTDYGNTMPTFQFEVISKGSGEIKQGLTVVSEYSQTGGYLTSQLGTSSTSIGEYFRNRFFANNIMFSHPSKGFSVKNLPVIKSVISYKAEMIPTSFYADNLRYYGSQVTRTDREDIKFDYDYEISKIYQYQDKDMIHEFFETPQAFSYNDTTNGLRIFASVGQIENSYYALYINSKMIDQAFNGVSGNLDYNNATLSVGKMDVASPENISFYAIDNLLPAGKFFKGAVITQDKNIGYIFYGDSNYATLSDTYYAKFVLEEPSISIIETGKFEEQMYFCGIGISNIDYVVGNADDNRYQYCASDNKYLWLIGLGNKATIFENENKTFIRKADVGIGNFQNQVNFYASSGLLYINDSVGSAVFSAIQTIDVSKVYLNDIIEDQLKRATLTEEFYDLTESENVQIQGYLVGSKSSARSNIETLANAYFFDLPESEGLLKVKMRGRDVVATITSDEFIIENESSGEARSDFEFKYIQELSLPNEVQVNYMNIDSDYVVGVQYARRLETDSTEANTLSIPILLTNDEALSIAEKTLYNVWLERETINFSTNTDYYYLEPTDIIKVIDYRNNEYTLRIIQKEEGDNGQIKWECVRDQRSAYIQNSKGVVANAQGPKEVKFIENTEILPMNLPLILDAQQDQSAYYLAASAKTEGSWKGAVTYKSLDKQTYSMINEGIFNSQMNTIYGNCVESLNSFDCFDIDTSSKITVNLRNKKSELSSKTYDELLMQKTNYALIGSEVVQFANATLVSEGVYTLTNFIRGMHGTEIYAKTHEQGERFVLLDMNKINTIADSLGSLNTDFWIAAISIGKSNLSQADEKKFSNNGQTITPLAPYSFENKSTNGDFILNWYRRARVNAGWINNIETPLDEDTESYIIEVFSDNTYTNIVNDYSVSSSTSFNYSTSLQISDFGSVQSSVYFKVYQVSSRIGKGFASIPILQ